MLNTPEKIQEIAPYGRSCASRTTFATLPSFARVQPLRAGEGHSFLWRRLHSLTGIVPIGAFLVETYRLQLRGRERAAGVDAQQVKFLNSLPLVRVLGVGVHLYSAGVSRALWRVDCAARTQQM